MCGYCLECAVVFDFLEKQQSADQPELVDNYVGFYLQESDNFQATIKETKNFHDFKTSIDIAFCRAWDMLLNDESSSIFEDVDESFGSKCINDFLSRINSQHVSNVISLGNMQLGADKVWFKEFIRKPEILIKESERILISYHQWWLEGVNKETSDSNGCFYQSFPAIWFSLAFLLKYHRSSEVIKRIALEMPAGTPMLQGFNDLWLQRRAFIACIEIHGVAFVLEHYEDIRLELIYYALLKRAFEAEDREILKSYLSNTPHWEWFLGCEQVLELISIQEQIG